MNLSTYMYNLFMTSIILLFILVAYLYYKITTAYKEAFQTLEGEYIVNGIDASTINENNINNLNIQPVNVSISVEDIRRVESIAKSTDGKTDIRTNVNTECILYQKQIDVLTEKLNDYRFQGLFNDLRRTYTVIEELTNKMNEVGCNK